MKDKYLHVVVAASGWDYDKLKYRRHRLCEFLKHRAETADVYWIYPETTTFRKPSSYLQAKRNIHIFYCKKNNQGIKETALPDYLPGGYMRSQFHFNNQRYNSIVSLLNSYRAKKVLWFTYPAFQYLLKATDWDLVVYDCSDLWSASDSSNKYKHLLTRTIQKKSEMVIMNNSDLIFASSEYLASRIKEITGKLAHVVENGVEFDLFANANTVEIDYLNNIPRPRLGFVGGMKFKIDFSLLENLAANNLKYSIVLIGPGPSERDNDFHRLIQLKNVYWMGAIKPEEVPNHMKCLDLGLLPYKEIEYNKAVFPLKLFEYLATGLLVIGCGLPSTKSYAKEDVYLHVDRKYFVSSCKALLENIFRDDTRAVNSRIEVAAKNSWFNKFVEIYRIIGINQ